MSFADNCNLGKIILYWLKTPRKSHIRSQYRLLHEAGSGISLNQFSISHAPIVWSTGLVLQGIKEDNTWLKEFWCWRVQYNPWQLLAVKTNWCYFNLDGCVLICQLSDLMLLSSRLENWCAFLLYICMAIHAWIFMQGMSVLFLVNKLSKH